MGCLWLFSSRVFSVDSETLTQTPIFACSQKEKERIVENKRQVQSLVNKSKTIVRLKPRNPEEKSSSQIIVQALCDFKQDQVGYTSLSLPPLSHTHSLTHTHTHTRYEVKYHCYKCNSVFPLYVLFSHLRK